MLPVFVGCSSASFLIGTDRTLWASGKNSCGRLGVGDTEDRSELEQVGGVCDVVQVSCTWRHVLCLDSQGDVWSWGWNKHGQLGLGDFEDRHEPQRVPGLKNIIHVSAGARHSLCIDAEGILKSCGSNDVHQLPQGRASLSYHTFQESNPDFLNPKDPVQSAHAGFVHSTVFLKQDKQIMTIGAGEPGSERRSRTTSYISPVELQSTPKQVFVGHYTVCIVDTEDDLWMYGKNNKGQQGTPFTDQILQPSRLERFSSNVITEVSIGGSHTMFLDSQGNCYGVGSNSEGQLGLEYEQIVSKPTRIPLDTTIVSISCGSSHSGAVDENATVWVFGANDCGQLGLQGQSRMSFVVRPTPLHSTKKSAKG